MSEYRPGDVVNGWELGQDLQWHPARVAPQSRATRTLPAQRWDVLAPAGGAGRWDDSWDGVVQGDAGNGPGAVEDRFDGAGPAPRSRKGVALGLGGAAAALLVGVAIGSSGGEAAPAAASAASAAPAATVTVTTTAAPAPAVTITKTAKATVTKTAEVQGFADTGSSASSSGSSSSAYYKNCSAARAAGAAPLYRGDPGYRSALDRDDDGVACE